MAEVKSNFVFIESKYVQMILSRADKRSIIYFLNRLNGFLEADDMRIGRFGRTLARFEKRFDFKIGVIDFKYYDEQRLMKGKHSVNPVLFSWEISIRLSEFL